MCVVCFRNRVSVRIILGFALSVALLFSMCVQVNSVCWRMRVPRMVISSVADVTLFAGMLESLRPIVSVSARAKKK